MSEKNSRVGCQDVATIVASNNNRKGGIERFIKKELKESRLGNALKGLSDTYESFQEATSGVLDPINNFTSAIGDTAEAIMGAATTGVFETVTFPKNFSLLHSSSWYSFQEKFKNSKRNLTGDL